MFGINNNQPLISTYQPPSFLQTKKDNENILPSEDKKIFGDTFLEFLISQNLASRAGSWIEDLTQVPLPQLEDEEKMRFYNIMHKPLILEADDKSFTLNVSIAEILFFLSIKEFYLVGNYLISKICGFSYLKRAFSQRGVPHVLDCSPESYWKEVLKTYDLDLRFFVDDPSSYTNQLVAYLASKLPAKYAGYNFNEKQQVVRLKILKEFARSPIDAVHPFAMLNLGDANFSVDFFFCKSLAREYLCWHDAIFAKCLLNGDTSLPLTMNVAMKGHINGGWDSLLLKAAHALNTDAIESINLKGLGSIVCEYVKGKRPLPLDKERQLVEEIERRFVEDKENERRFADILFKRLPNHAAKRMLLVNCISPLFKKHSKAYLLDSLLPLFLEQKEPTKLKNFPKEPLELFSQVANYAYSDKDLGESFSFYMYIFARLALVQRNIDALDPKFEIFTRDIEQETQLLIKFKVLPRPLYLILKGDFSNNTYNAIEGTRTEFKENSYFYDLLLAFYESLMPLPPVSCGYNDSYYMQDFDQSDALAYQSLQLLAAKHLFFKTFGFSIVCYSAIASKLSKFLLPLFKSLPYILVEQKSAQTRQHLFAHFMHYALSSIEFKERFQEHQLHLQAFYEDLGKGCLSRISLLQKFCLAFIGIDQGVLFSAVYGLLKEVYKENPRAFNGDIACKLYHNISAKSIRERAKLIVLLLKDNLDSYRKIFPLFLDCYKKSSANTKELLSLAKAACALISRVTDRKLWGNTEKNVLLGLSKKLLQYGLLQGITLMQLGNEKKLFSHSFSDLIKDRTSESLWKDNEKVKASLLIAWAENEDLHFKECKKIKQSAYAIEDRLELLLEGYTCHLPAQEAKKLALWIAKGMYFLACSPSLKLQKALKAKVESLLADLFNHCEREKGDSLYLCSFLDDIYSYNLMSLPAFDENLWQVWDSEMQAAEDRRIFGNVLLSYLDRPCACKMADLYLKMALFSFQRQKAGMDLRYIKAALSFAKAGELKEVSTCAFKLLSYLIEDKHQRQACDLFALLSSPLFKDYKEDVLNYGKSIVVMLADTPFFLFPFLNAYPYLKTEPTCYETVQACLYSLIKETRKKLTLNPGLLDETQKTSRQRQKRGQRHIAAQPDVQREITLIAEHIEHFEFFSQPLWLELCLLVKEAKNSKLSKSAITSFEVVATQNPWTTSSKEIALCWSFLLPIALQVYELLFLSLSKRHLEFIKIAELDLNLTKEILPYYLLGILSLLNRQNISLEEKSSLFAIALSLEEKLVENKEINKQLQQQICFAGIQGRINMGGEKNILASWLKSWQLLYSYCDDNQQKGLELLCALLQTTLGDVPMIKNNQSLMIAIASCANVLEKKKCYNFLVPYFQLFAKLENKIILQVSNGILSRLPKDFVTKEAITLAQKNYNLSLNNGLYNLALPLLRTPYFKGFNILRHKEGILSLYLDKSAGEYNLTEIKSILSLYRDIAPHIEVNNVKAGEIALKIVDVIMALYFTHKDVGAFYNEMLELSRLHTTIMPLELKAVRNTLIDAVQGFGYEGFAEAITVQDRCSFDYLTFVNFSGQNILNKGSMAGRLYKMVKCMTHKLLRQVPKNKEEQGFIIITIAQHLLFFLRFYPSNFAQNLALAKAFIIYDNNLFEENFKLYRHLRQSVGSLVFEQIISLHQLQGQYFKDLIKYSFLIDAVSVKGVPAELKRRLFLQQLEVLLTKNTPLNVLDALLALKKEQKMFIGSQEELILAYDLIFNTMEACNFIFHPLFGEPLIYTFFDTMSQIDETFNFDLNFEEFMQERYEERIHAKINPTQELP